MSKGIDKILKRSGTGQLQRFLKALDPATFDLHDFTIEDWILFAYNFAKNVNYFDTNNDEKPSNDWQAFFKEFNAEDQLLESRTTREYKKLKENIQQTLTEYKENQSLTPHLTLFVCFLQLLEISKKRFNNLTKRHLDFYYKEILQVDKQAAISDQVHILLELARRSSEEKIDQGTELNGDKDANDNDLIYKTNEEIVVNKAKVSDLKSIYNGKKFTDPDKVGANPFQFKASQVANTLDGLEEPLLEESPYWYPFGYTSAEENYTELENAEIGFAISSPMLQLQEGLRTVTLTIKFEGEEDEDTSTSSASKKDDKNSFESVYTPEVLEKIISIYASGEEDWVGPLQLKTKANDTDSETSEAVTVTLKKTELKLVFQLTQEEDALVNYNEEFLLKKYNVEAPVVRFLIDSGTSQGYNLYKGLSKKVITEITLKVDVEDAKTVIAENDNGILKTAKPFYPFTTQPLLKSNFYVNYPEAFSKKWSDFTIKFNWKNTPESFTDWYAAYIEKQKLATNKKEYGEQSVDATSVKIINADTDFKAQKAILHKEIWEPETESKELFESIKDAAGEPTGEFNCTIKFLNPGGETEIDKAGPVRLSLEQTFLHKLYPRLYALSLTTDGDQLIPNEPYTPIAENLVISYSAEETLFVKSQVFPITEENKLEEQNSVKVFKNNRIKLFHEHPFGFVQEHNYLKLARFEKGIRDRYDGTTIKSYLVPTYCRGGELLIGLEDAEALQSISLLIQVLEGSENPLVPSFDENEDVEWSVLCSNGWKDLKEYIITNNTGNFLNSGIIQMSIPKEATKDNTLLPEDRIWLRAKVHKSYDVVCKVIDIHTQAVLAKFSNQDNELSHLAAGLPSETIKKLITRVPQIKSVTQPYNSFGGVPEESDEHFYRRISERLRHKNRAITLWDYEHLILQKFPEIYKVKCLNHTSENSFSAPGEVSIVAIPDTVNKNVFDVFEPRLSKGLLNRVEEYINQLNSMHVDAKIINPNYEQVFVKLQVQFYEGLDKSFYSKKIEQDIIKFLSPWAFDDSKEVEFGITLHKSVLIDYLEKLDYVDYLQNVEIKKGEKGKAKNNLSPSNPKSILVSAKAHSISTVLSNCQGEQKEPTKVCQV